MRSLRWLRISGVLAVMVAAAVGWSCSQTPPTEPVVLAVLAHPDDDVMIAPLLAHYAKRGTPVHGCFITTIVDVRDGLEAAAEGHKAYVSQHTPEQMAVVRQILQDVLDGKQHLRLALSRVPWPADGAETDLLSGLSLAATKPTQ